jgi:UDP-N-acetylglucosamine 2-epimerase
VRLVEPLDYAAFVKLLTSATLVVTDSGGVQEEAAALGIPLLVTRRTSERPEALDAGVAELVGTDPDRLATTARRLLTDPAVYAERAVPTDAFGDGRAGERIAELLLG